MTIEQIFELFNGFLYTLYFVARCSVFSDKDGNVVVLYISNRDTTANEQIKAGKYIDAIEQKASNDSPRLYSFTNFRRIQIIAMITLLQDKHTQ